MSNQEKIDKVVKKIIKNFSPEKIILFGSYAWGKPAKDSDVDLFVIQRSSERRLDRNVKIRRAIFPAGIAVDVISYTPDEVQTRLQKGDFFIKRILTKGKLLYGK
ncbi:MAG: nucleotidyltransferase domain-containing protein [Candidatus Doudnabacteria bacterium]|nr:nucleotidyltransferase domain-containing protein [Candidatus Doudnabacteria bacterium]